LLDLSPICVSGQDFYKIPEQILNLNEMTGRDFVFIDTIMAFEISEFVTLGEYKEFLNSIKTDSTEIYYQKMLPDSAIAINAEMYSDYLNHKKYEKYPVLGIKWESAIEFCKWKTKVCNSEANIYYKLPTCSEWFAAYSYLEKNSKNHDFDKKYSDMTLVAYDEAGFFYNANSYFTLDFQYNHKPDDPPAVKRKRIVGSSYAFDMNNFLNSYFYIYSYEGYRYVSFRVVKHKK